MTSGIPYWNYKNRPENQQIDYLIIDRYKGTTYNSLLKINNLRYGAYQTVKYQGQHPIEPIKKDEGVSFKVS
uniref:hypothetical protein n=1 Tax=Psychrobacter sp. TaxID=56811 RepID=UPI0015EF0488|nr:hypothetical protein [Psychrobacter sp.]